MIRQKLVDGALEDMTADEIADLMALLPPEPVEPKFKQLEPYQFHAMVNLTGHADEILQAIVEDPDPVFSAAALAKYQHSTYYKRDDPFVVALAAQIGLTEEQLDTLWLDAQEF